MPGELLHVPQAAPDLGHFARGAGNEGAAPGMRRTAVHLQRRIQPMEPQAHGRRRQPPAPLGEEEGPIRSHRVPPPRLERDQRGRHLGVHGAVV